MESQTTACTRVQGVVLGALLLANAAAILFMPSFTTVDGPMHTLRASVIEAAWTTPRYCAEGIGYDESAVGLRIGDLFRIVLLHLVGPERAETVFAVLVSLCLLAAVLAYLRAHGTRANAAMLWLAPLSFSFILVIGFLDFILGLALCLAVVARWEHWRGRPLLRWALLLGGMVVGWYTHHGAPVLLAFLLFASLAFGGRNWSHALAWDRGRLLLRAVPILALLLATAWVLRTVLQDIALNSAPMKVLYDKWFLVRPLLLFHAGEEGFIIALFGVLLTITLAACISARWHLGKKLLVLDRFLLLALLFATIPFAIETKETRLLYVPERCQWLALLFFALWAIALAGAQPGLPSRVIITLAWAALPLQAIRLYEAKAVYAGLARAQTLTKEAVGALASSSLAVPVMAESNWLLNHLGGVVAMHHNGVCLSRDEHLSYRVAAASYSPVRSTPLLLQSPPTWLPFHWETCERPMVDHILFIGTDDSTRTTWQVHWKDMLERNYRQTFDNGYVTVYSALSREDDAAQAGRPTGSPAETGAVNASGL